MSLKIKEIILKLNEIDDWLYQGRRDNAHYLILDLIRELEAYDSRREQSISTKNNP